MGLFVCPASHAYVHYQMSEENKLSKLLRPEEVPIPAYSNSLEYGHMQQRICGKQGLHGLRYYDFIIILCYNQWDVLALEGLSSCNTKACNSLEAIRSCKGCTRKQSIQGDR